LPKIFGGLRFLLIPMTTAFDTQTEKKIRNSVKLGDPWALDELIAEICEDSSELRHKFGEIVADEYRRRLSTMLRSEMRELYRRCFKEESDANKDWLLGEIVENIEAETN
jgi:hypothetical protein